MPGRDLHSLWVDVSPARTSTNLKLELVGIMTPELWARLSTLFDDAVEKSSRERRTFIAAVRGENLGWGREFAAFVEAHE
jgi:hypothetical protein